MVLHFPIMLETDVTDTASSVAAERMSSESTFSLLWNLAPTPFAAEPADIVDPDTQNSPLDRYFSRDIVSDISLNTPDTQISDATAASLESKYGDVLISDSEDNERQEDQLSRRSRPKKLRRLRRSSASDSEPATPVSAPSLTPAAFSSPHIGGAVP